MPDAVLAPDTVVSVVDVTGVLANAVLGGAVARSLKMDPVGFFSLALVSGVGGGLVRDVLLQNGLPAALTGPTYLLAVVVGAVAAFLIDLRSRWANGVLIGLDSLALGCWSAIGVIKALAVGVHWFPALLIGVVTAVGGGVLRDVLVGTVPAIFGTGPLYATVAVIGSIETLALAQIGLGRVGIIASILTCGLLATLARVRGWYLPTAVEWNAGAGRRVVRALARRRSWRAFHGPSRTSHNRRSSPSRPETTLGSSQREDQQ